MKDGMHKCNAEIYYSSNERNLSLLQNGSSTPSRQSDCLREKHFYLIQTSTTLMSHLFIYRGYQLA